ncbi:hypothetical protein HYZ41_02255, partial [archaeon]|nr:hypothetical protein [archaeon]
LLLVSVSNTRDKSRVVLPRGTEIIINLPNETGSKLECGDQVTLAKTGDKYYREGYDTLVYVVKPSDITQNSIEILPYEFNSIFSFLCTFKTNPGVEVSRSGFITAELPRYIFRVEQTKDVPITPRLGILYDPWENVCKKITDEDKCINRTSGDDKCYWDSTLTAGDIAETVGGVATTPTSVLGVTGKISKSSDCHSCGPKVSRSCDMFKKPNCGTKTGSDACNIPCKWMNLAEMEAKKLVPNEIQTREKGMCAPTVSGNGKCEVITTGPCSVDSLKDKCSWTPEQASKICNVESKGGNPIIESGSDKCSDGNSFSAGLFQINVLAHGKLIEEAASLTSGTCQNLYTMDCNGKIGDSACCSKRNEGEVCIEWKCHVKSDRLDDFNKCKNAVKNADVNIAIACKLYTAKPSWGDWSYTKDKVCGDNLYKTTSASDASTADASSWKINGKTGLVEIGEVFDDKFQAQVKSVEGNKFTISLKWLYLGNYVDADCNTGSGTDAVLTEGSSVSCEARSTFAQADDIRFKLVSVDSEKKNIVLSVGPGPKYEETIGLGAVYVDVIKSENPLPDWTLYVNNQPGNLGAMKQIFTDVRISLAEVGDSSAKFFAYTRTNSGWGMADCSDWVFKVGVTIDLGKSEGCNPQGSYIEDFKIQLDKIDQGSKNVYVTVSSTASATTSTSAASVVTGDLVAGAANRVKFYSTSLGEEKYYNIYLPPSYNDKKNSTL